MNNPKRADENSDNQLVSPLQSLLGKMIYAGAFFGSLGLLYSLLYWTSGKMLQTPAAFFLSVVALNIANIVLSFSLLAGAWLLRTGKTLLLKKCYGLSLAALGVKFLVFMITPNISFGWAFLASVAFVSTLVALVNQQYSKGV